MENNQQSEPTKEQVAEFLKIVQDALVFQALRSCGGQPNPSVILTYSWLKKKFNVD